MSHWNYRIMRRVQGKVRTFGIYEVYYDEDGKVDGWTEGSASVFGETLAELMNDLKYMQRALKRPVLDYKTGREVKS